MHRHSTNNYCGSEWKNWLFYVNVVLIRQSRNTYRKLSQRVDEFLIMHGANINLKGQSEAKSILCFHGDHDKVDTTNSESDLYMTKHTLSTRRNTSENETIITMRGSSLYEFEANNKR